MKPQIDSRGLACPQPVINTKKALENNESVIAIVDNNSAVENIRRMAKSMGCSLSEEIKGDGIYLTIEKKLSPNAAAGKNEPDIANSQPARGASLLVISQDVIGKGDDDLGRILIRSFFHILSETPPVPEAIVFLNSGVKLVAQGSEVSDDLKSLEKKGVKILACGTCLDYYKLKDKILAGSISNMYEIKDLMLSGRSVVNI
jgi:selenium metabolism protein YedF